MPSSGERIFWYINDGGRHAPSRVSPAVGLSGILDIQIFIRHRASFPLRTGSVRYLPRGCIGSSAGQFEVAADGSPAGRSGPFRRVVKPVAAPGFSEAG